MYKIIDIKYYHTNGNKSLIIYEKNGVRRQQELNGTIDKKTAIHILQKRGM